MDIRSFLFLATPSHGYLFVKPDELSAVVPAPDDIDSLIEIEGTFPQNDGLISMIQNQNQGPFTDAIGNTWFFLEEDCEAPAFTDRYADYLGIFPHQLWEHIQRYHTNKDLPEILAILAADKDFAIALTNSPLTTIPHMFEE